MPRSLTPGAHQCRLAQRGQFRVVAPRLPVAPLRAEVGCPPLLYAELGGLPVHVLMRSPVCAVGYSRFGCTAGRDHTPPDGADLDVLRERPRRHGRARGGQVGDCLVCRCLNSAVNLRLGWRLAGPSEAGAVEDQRAPGSRAEVTRRRRPSGAGTGRECRPSPSTAAACLAGSAGPRPGRSAARRRCTGGPSRRRGRTRRRAALPGAAATASFAGSPR